MKTHKALGEVVNRAFFRGQCFEGVATREVELHEGGGVVLGLV